MKNFKFLFLVLLIFAILPACEQDNVLDEPTDFISENFDDVERNQNPRPFHATFISGFTQPPAPNASVCGTGSPAPIWHLVQSIFEGNATHMGNISGSISSCLDLNTFTFISSLTTIVAANGDTLLITGTIDPFPIDGGSGRFEDASGWVIADYEEIEDGVFSNDWNGEILY